MHVQVEILFFDAAGSRHTGTHELAAGAKLEDLLAELGSLPPEAVCLVNGRAAGPEVSLKDGDRITILPRALGGRTAI